MIESDRPEWYLVQARPRQATPAMVNLRQQGYCVFHPRIRFEQVRRGRRTVVEQSLFPDYLFIRLQPGVDNSGPVRSTRGVLQLVGFGNVPFPFDADFIEMLRTRLEAQHDSAPTLRLDDVMQTTPAPEQALEKMLALADPRDRMQTLMNLLRRQMTTTLCSVRRSSRTVQAGAWSEDPAVST